MNNHRNNNNNNSNNRRRGRGNSRPQGNGQPINRIDSRARGNAPQMLEKYRKLAHDAHLNGDRVQAEYFLQFADHYFRVIADTRQRQEEARVRRDERGPDGGEGFRDESEDAGDFSVESDFPNFDQPIYTRREREERSRDDRPRNDGPRNDGPRNDGARNDGPRNERQREDRPREDRPRNDRQGEDRERQPRGEDRRPRQQAAQAAEPVAQPAAEDSDAANPYEPPENPFLRESRAPRGGLRPRREGAPRREPRGDDAGEAPIGLDPSSLPPPISASRETVAAVTASDEAPRRRTRRKPAADGAGEALEPVG